MTVDQKCSELLEFIKQVKPPALYFDQKSKSKMRKEQQQPCFPQKETPKLNMQVYFGIACIHKGETGGKNGGKRASMQKWGLSTAPRKSVPGGILGVQEYFLYIKTVKTQKQNTLRNIMLTLR